MLVEQRCIPNVESDRIVVLLLLLRRKRSKCFRAHLFVLLAKSRKRLEAHNLLNEDVWSINRPEFTSFLCHRKTQEIHPPQVSDELELTRALFL